MARAVVALLIAAAPLAWGSAWALGPQAPFTPPPLTPTLAGTPAASPRASASAPLRATASEPMTVAAVRRGASPGALIDGRWLHVGDTHRGHRLHEVRADGVRLTRPDGRAVALLLFAPASAGPAASAAPTGSSE